VLLGLMMLLRIVVITTTPFLKKTPRHANNLILFEGEIP